MFYDMIQNPSFRKRIYPIILLSLLFTIVLALKSLTDFTRTGPTIREEILEHYMLYSIYAISRLAGWTFVISSVLFGLGAALYECLRWLFGWRYRIIFSILSAGFVFFYISFMQFSHHLLYIPSAINASFLYRTSRLYPLWELLSPKAITVLHLSISFLLFAIIFSTLLKLLRKRNFRAAALISSFVFLSVSFVVWSSWSPEPQPVADYTPKDRPNILMIGSDSLRADRLGALSYHRDITPRIDDLASRSVQFTNSYVPLARTAPSLASILTGTWPHTHGIRGNYIADSETSLTVSDLPRILNEDGYRTAVISDWAGGDLGKLNYGFQEKDVAEDQWNLKYLIRQGPKDIRLFLSLFANNRFGKFFLPEIYYLAGTPLGKYIGRDARKKIGEMASSDAPFFLLLFTSNTHVPFGSEYPYYTLFADPMYAGESKFVMSGLTDPAEIIRRQTQGKNAFDVQQIIDLYDGAVKSFDDEVGRILDYLSRSSLLEDTVIVIFSDHGIDLFEKYTWGQGNTLLGADPSSRIPLIIFDPKRTSSGITVSKTVRSIDIAPTLLALAGLPIPESVEGVSLVPYFSDSGIDLDLTAFIETGVWLAAIPGMQENHMKYPSLLELLEIRDRSTGTLSIKPDLYNTAIEARDRMLRTDKWKLVYFPMIDGAEFWLFDIQSDTQNDIDVSSSNPEVVAFLKDTLIDWMSNDRSRIFVDDHMKSVD